MQSFRLDPYLWIHLAGIAALPILLEVCLLGLAVGYPLLPPVLEVAILAAIGIGPILWMQWTRPFYIFSLLAVALQPEKLSDQQRQMLRFFKTPVAKGFTLVAPVVLIWALWQLYKLAPIAADFTPISSQLRLVGLLVAAIAFLACNLFLQVPLSVLHVLLVSPQSVENAEAYPLAEIPQDFTLIGLRIPKILPQLKAEPKAAAVDLPRREEGQGERGEQEEQGSEGADLGASDTASDADDVWGEDEGAISEVEDEGDEGAIADLADLSEPESEDEQGAIAADESSDESDEWVESVAEADEVYETVGEDIQVTDRALAEKEGSLAVGTELTSNGDESLPDEPAAEPEMAAPAADVTEESKDDTAAAEPEPSLTSALDDNDVAGDDDAGEAEPETATDVNPDMNENDKD